MHECLNCEAPVDDSQICWSCSKVLRRLLRGVPWLLDRLHETAYGQGKTAREKLRVSGEGEKPGLPLNMRAADVRRELITCTLGAFIRCAVPYGLVGPILPWQWRSLAVTDAHRATPGGADDLAEHPAELMQWHGVDALLGDVRRLSEEGERLIDLPADSHYYGPCPQCASGLYADADDASPEVRCGGCMWAWPIDWVRDNALQSANRQQYSAADCLRLVRVLRGDSAPPRSSFYALLTQVQPSEIVGDRVWYRLGDVVEVLDEHARAEAARLAEGRKKRGRPRKAKKVVASTSSCVTVDTSTHKGRES
ncbi:Uncharacterised protein [Mycobacteroides abscessus subsp. bolletii]|uniref:hypothetical protein n=1 Tax=Mycobacteroides abscessus TaxID=36809 RepID=UPI000929FE22|nr:hypothetical protein [Mycobacteroides abscessus]SHX92553.1 Uncharacterised protein [Mycobacteroides abscessus subsp. bolletii]SKP82672.1 Uncharacterised protein [Mycobacteroides abscessus subsp. bolletii]SKP99332.1 Uncharacterised protein [Mycobacteroides abscessus subsp. bolletii]SKQ16557.1 Uncharacterised protein [Mycobacteroides abscessus subsp. bolletii]